jgi:Domain of unknown function (DUF4760)
LVDLTEITTMVAAAGVLVGVVWYILDMRNQTRTRHTELVMRLYATFSSDEFQDAWANIVNRPREFETYDNLSDVEKKASNREGNQVCLFFEGIGILLQRKLLDAKMVEDLFGGSVARAWEQVKTDVFKGRKRFNDPTIYYYFEYLYNEMKRREQKHQPKS